MRLLILIAALWCVVAPEGVKRGQFETVEVEEDSHSTDVPDEEKRVAFLRVTAERRGEKSVRVMKVAGNEGVKKVYLLDEKRGVNATIEKRGVNATIEKRGVNATIEKRGVNATIEKRALNATIEKRGVNATIEKRGVNATIEKRGVNATIEKRGVNATIEKRGVNATIDKRGVNATIEKRGVNATIDKRGVNATIEKRGLNATIEKRDVNASIDKRGVNATIEKRGVNATIEKKGLKMIIGKRRLSKVNLDVNMVEIRRSADIGGGILPARNDRNINLAAEKRDIGGVTLDLTARRAPEGRVYAEKRDIDESILSARKARTGKVDAE